MNNTMLKIFVLLAFLSIITSCKDKDTIPAGGEKKVPESAPEKVITPSFDLEAGTYNTDQSLRITNNTTGATIYYTTNGNYPTAKAAEYISAIPIKNHGTEMTIKAVALKEGMQNSSVVESIYIINYDAVAMPITSIPAGIYNSNQSIILSSTTTGATIKYTTDGAEPTPSTGTIYTTAIPLSNITTLRAIAYKTGLVDSSILSAIFDFQLPDLTFTPTNTSINVGNLVNISLALSDATIQYTIGDGSQNDPICGSSDPSGDVGASSVDVTIDSDQTIKAIACKTDWFDSNIGASAYTSYPKIYAVDSASNDRIIRMDNLEGDNWITYGDNSGDSFINNPADIHIVPSGIYIADYGNDRIIRIDDMNGSNLISFSSSGPTGIFVDSSGKIYITEGRAHRILRIDDMQGTNPIIFGGTGPGWAGQGNGIGEFNAPNAIHLDSSDRIYIADYTNNRIVRIDDMSGTGWTTWGSSGTGTNQFRSPSGVAIDLSNRIYITDYSNHRVVRMNDMSGDGWTTLGGLTGSSAIGKFNYPKGIFIDATDRMYVADYRNYRVVRTDTMSTTNWSSLSGSNGNGENEFKMLMKIFVW